MALPWLPVIKHGPTFIILCIQSHLLEALALRRSISGDTLTDDAASTLFNLGFLYARMGGSYHFRKSVDVHEQSLDMYRKLPGNYHYPWSSSDWSPLMGTVCIRIHVLAFLRDWVFIQLIAKCSHTCEFYVRTATYEFSVFVVDRSF